jgi:hypothetical protein
MCGFGVVMGINQYKTYVRTLSNGQKISIAKNLDIDGDNYRIDDDRGEGCNTRWFPTIKALIAFAEKSLSNDFENNGVYL